MPQTASDLLPETRRALLHRLAVGQAEGRAPSMVGAVVREGRSVWFDARSCVDGHAPTADVQYRIGSLTKTFVAVLILRLRDEGLLDLADPLGRHLPGTTADDLTVFQLLSHTAGLAAETDGSWWERTDGELRPGLSDVLGGKPFPAGRRHHYSNPGYALLGALVGQLRGEAWGEVLRREVLEPLGMTRTTLPPQSPHAGGWAVHPWADVILPEPLADTGLMAPAGQLWSTASDLGRWAAFLAGGDEKVLGLETIAEMRAAVTPVEEDWSSGYGLGLQVVRKHGRTMYGHTGTMPGFQAGLWVSEEDGLAAVVLANTTSQSAAPEVAADLIRIVAEREPRIPDPWRPLPEVDTELLALTGPWYWGPAVFVLRLKADRALELSALGGQGRSSRFLAEPDGTWTGQDGYYAGETLRVIRGGDGTVSHLDLGSFVLTRGPYDPAEPIPGGVDPGGWTVG